MPVSLRKNIKGGYFIIKHKIKNLLAVTYNEDSCKVYVFYLLKENPT